MNNNTAITDLINLFGEETLSELPFYTRKTLEISENGTSAKAKYEAKIFPRDWAEKDQESLKSIIGDWTERKEYGGGIVIKDFADDSCFFKSRLEIEIKKVNEESYKYYIQITHFDHEPEGYITENSSMVHYHDAIYSRIINHQKANVPDTIKKIAADKSLLKNIHTTKHIADRICTGLKHLNSIMYTPNRILYYLPSFCMRADNAFLPGSTVRMGIVPESHKIADARGNAIRWWVADIDYEHNRALVVSKRILTHKKPYEAANKTNWKSFPYRWSDCDINKWLNSEFIPLYGLSNVPIVNVAHKTTIKQRTSSSSEKIITTDEKVFILSQEEMSKYFSLIGTSWYAAQLDSQYLGESVACRNTIYNSYTNNSEMDRVRESPTVCTPVSIRPAFWVDLDYAKAHVQRP